MKLVAICLAALGICCASVAGDRASVTFRATVQEIVMLSKYSGTVRLVHFDPRFALKLKIEMATEDAPELVIGETVVFAIHSPAQLFAPDADATGKSFTFSVMREIADGKPKFRLLQIEREAEQARRANAAGRRPKFVRVHRCRELCRRHGSRVSLARSVMRLETLIELFPKLRMRDCTVSFDDGDSYAIRDLDFQGFYDDRYEIVVEFEKCLRASKAREEALRHGHLRPERTSWTSTIPHTPVARTYYADEIACVFDREDKYAVFEKEANKAVDPTPGTAPRNSGGSSED